MEVVEIIKNSIIEGEEKAKNYSKFKKRELYKKLLKGRLHVIYGLRGTGKTTLLFQRFLDYKKGERIYLDGEELALVGVKLIDVFRNLMYFLKGRGAVFIDEINALEEWEKEVKIIYDKYDYDIYISGSSTLDLKKSKNVLARRAHYHNLNPLSFREFLEINKNIKIKRFKLEKKDLFSEAIRYEIYFKEKVKEDPIKLVEEYKEKSLPFMFEGNEEMLMDLVEKIIYSDIAKTSKFKIEIINKMLRLLLILSLSEKTSYENISKDLGVSKSVVGEVIKVFVESGILKQVLPFGSARIVGRKTWRYFFVVPKIREVLAKKTSFEEAKLKGLIREDLFISHIDNVFYLKEHADFVYKNRVYEVGGSYKSVEQLRKTKLDMEKVIVYDGYEVKKEKRIVKLPLYMFLLHV